MENIKIQKKNKTKGVVFEYEYDFDKNGLIYALGLNFGKDEYE